MDRTSKSRVLTAADVMLAHDRACERIKKDIVESRSAVYAFESLKVVAGVEMVCEELLALLTEDENNG